MSKNASAIVVLSLLFTGCAAATPQPRQYEGPRDQPQAQPQQPAAPALKLDLPHGWQQGAPPPGPGSEAISAMLGNQALGAVILVALYGTQEVSPKDVAATVAAKIKENGTEVSEVTVSADGKSASFTWRHPANNTTGKMAAQVLAGAPELSIMFMGIWPADSDAAATADFDAIIKSARVKSE